MDRGVLMKERIMKVKLPKRWYVVADAGRAAAYVRRDDGAGYRLVARWMSELVLPSDRQPDATDKPGRAFDRMGDHRHAMETVPPKELIKQAFGRGLAQALNKARSEGFYEDIVICAPARFLHELRDNLDKNTAQVVARSEPKDLTKLPEQELFDAFDELGGIPTDRSRARYPSA
jgi:protein required for attachment to host cells